ncbi:MAG: hypothetical protein EOO56_14180 [Hymenobacter sp.]|nr:MAG: hypothetical protein EOO56_14180 [Hymenobacter sp.]
MLRTILFLTGLLGLLTTAAMASPAENASANWRGWGFRHRRPSQGDFVPVYATYRYHSRERHGLFGFLHQSNPTARHLSKKQLPHLASARKHTAGRF